MAPFTCEKEVMNWIKNEKSVAQQPRDFFLGEKKTSGRSYTFVVQKSSSLLYFLWGVFILAKTGHAILVYCFAIFINSLMVLNLINKPAIPIVCCWSEEQINKVHTHLGIHQVKGPVDHGTIFFLFSWKFSFFRGKKALVSDSHKNSSQLPTLSTLGTGLFWWCQPCQNMQQKNGVYDVPRRGGASNILEAITLDAYVINGI